MRCIQRERAILEQKLESQVIKTLNGYRLPNADQNSLSKDQTL